MYETSETQDDSHFWAEAAQGRISIQRCAACRFLRWPAAGVCPECLSRDFMWEQVDPTGDVWSYAVYHRAYSVAHKHRLPYNVALIQLDCGVRLLSTLVGFGTDEVPLGTRVVARFEPLGEHASVPVFGPAVSRPGGPSEGPA